MRRCYGDIRGRSPLIILFFVTLRCTPVRLHPQCLDFKPPFRPQQELQFCSPYKEFGCCNYEKDQDLLTKFYRIMGNFDYHGYANCASYVQELLCQVGMHGQRSYPCPVHFNGLTVIESMLSSTVHQLSNIIEAMLHALKLMLVPIPPCPTPSPILLSILKRSFRNVHHMLLTSSTRRTPALPSAPSQGFAQTTVHSSGRSAAPLWTSSPTTHTWPK